MLEECYAKHTSGCEETRGSSQRSLETSQRSLETMLEPKKCLKKEMGQYHPKIPQ